MDCEGSLALGTLQFLADKPQDAMAAFEKAWQKAETEPQQRDVADGVILTIRARDGVAASHDFMRSLVADGIPAAVERVSASE